MRNKPKNRRNKGIYTFALLLYALPLLLNLFFYSFERELPIQSKNFSFENQSKESADNDDNHFAALLDKKLETAVSDFDESQIERLTRCKSLVYQALQQIPASHSSQLKKITFMFDPDLRRGYGGQTSIRLRCNEVADEELVAVFWHEIGHIVDTGLKTGSFLAGKSAFKDGDINIYKNDPSLKFYIISWKDEKTSKSQNRLNFISGYAKVDPFEDFAESYNTYIAQGSRFRSYAEKNTLIARKYFILKKHFFENREYGLEENENIFPPLERNFDTTILPFNLTTSLQQSDEQTAS